MIYSSTRYLHNLRFINHLRHPDKANRSTGGNDYTLLAREMDVRTGGREHEQGRWVAGVASTFDAVYHDVIAGERIVYAYEMHLNDHKNPAIVCQS